MHAVVGERRRRRDSRAIPLATTMPRPMLTTVSRCHSLVPARCSRNGACTKTVATIARPTTTQRTRRPRAVETCAEKRARSRSQIIGNARKNGAPTNACHQLPWLPGTRRVTASHADVSTANGRNVTEPATIHISKTKMSNHTGLRSSSNRADLSSYTTLREFPTMTSNGSTYNSPQMFHLDQKISI